MGFDHVQYARDKADAKSRATGKPCVPPPEHVEDFPLLMPSELSKAERRKYCPNNLADTEDRIRFAEALDALERLRHHLRTRSFANIFKIANITGQTRNSRAREKQNTIDDKVRGSALKYRRARQALKNLRGLGPWELVLQVLDDGDIRALNERELTLQEKNAQEAVHFKNGVVTVEDTELADQARRTQKSVSVGEGHRTPSWIWMTSVGVEKISDPLTRKGMSVPCSLTSLNHLTHRLALRVEWTKARARGARWLEEVVHLDEEMRRVLESSTTEIGRWREQVLRRPLLQPGEKILREGLSAYAEEHIDREATIIQLWGEKWRAIRSLASPIIAGDIPDDTDEAAYAGASETLEVDMGEMEDAEEEDNFQM